MGSYPTSVAPKHPLTHHRAQSAPWLTSEVGAMRQDERLLGCAQHKSQCKSDQKEIISEPTLWWHWKHKISLSQLHPVGLFQVIWEPTWSWPTGWHQNPWKPAVSYLLATLRIKLIVSALMRTPQAYRSACLDEPSSACCPAVLQTTSPFICVNWDQWWL